MIACPSSDKFNSKKAGNADWQFNALIGLNIKFGKGYTETKPVYYEAEPVVVEQPKPAPVVEQPQPKKEVVVQPMTGYLLCFELSEDTRRSKVKNRYVGRISAKQSGCKG